MDAHDQRAFIRFVTGCPRLPAGQLKNLNPRLSIVRIPCVFTADPESQTASKTPSFKAEGKDKDAEDGPGMEEELDSKEKERACSLPSAMTCTNYLKLPDYPSKELMKRKLLTSIHECQTGFALS